MLLSKTAQLAWRQGWNLAQGDLAPPDHWVTIGGEHIPIMTPSGGAPVETPEPKTSITRTSSTKNVDSYTPGGMIAEDGLHYQVTGYNRRQNDHGSYEHTMSVKPATPEQVHGIKLKKANDELNSARNMAGDRVRVRAAENNVRSLTGQPLLPHIANQAAGKREEAQKILTQSTDPAGRAYKARNIIAEAGLRKNVNYSTNPKSIPDIDAALHEIITAKDEDGRMNKLVS